ncbi:TOBE domain-containing protein [Agilicoccus flavus]|uniref:TOBE domain-containing protein n=1 Tax=Agilicoccus flavus TaxID=2775968 RepID=UPI001CF69114|nr:TOBE domain-containing protein [Agilicoccus flavus]
MEDVSAPRYRVREAAELLGVSDDTLRRWIDQGALAGRRAGADRLWVDGVDLAAFARARAAAPPEGLGIGSSARNRFTGLVTRVVSDRVMSEVELQCGPFAVVSLMSTESVRVLGLAPGARAVAVVKATTVIVDTPASS